MRIARYMLLGGVLFLLAGCFQVTTVVRVNPDGSGTVEESMLFSKKLLAQLDELMRSLPLDKTSGTKPLELFEPEKLKAHAETMGEGVSYQSVRKVADADYEGFAATFSFKDINRLRLSQAHAPSGMPGISELAPSEPVIFRFSKGTQSTLTIMQPHGNGGRNSPPRTQDRTAITMPDAAGKIPAGDAAELMELFAGMKVSLAVEVNGSIIETNATYRDGQRLTILDLDMNKFVGNASHLGKLTQLDPNSLEDARLLIRDIPGMKADLNEELRVVFWQR